MENEEEIWKDIPGYEGYYQISTFGNVKSLKRLQFNGSGTYFSKERILRPAIRSGYYFVCLHKDKVESIKTIHVLVAITFLGHIPDGFKKVADHKDGDRLNNKLWNIQVVTNRENTSACFRKNSSTFSSKYIGVHWDSHAGKWMSRIQINGKRIHLGMFNDELNASIAYQNALSKL